MGEDPVLGALHRQKIAGRQGRSVTGPLPCPADSNFGRDMMLLAYATARDEPERNGIAAPSCLLPYGDLHRCRFQARTIGDSCAVVPCPELLNIARGRGAHATCLEVGSITKRSMRVIRIVSSLAGDVNAKAATRKSRESPRRQLSDCRFQHRLRPDRR